MRLAIYWRSRSVVPDLLAHSYLSTSRLMAVSWQVLLYVDLHGHSKKSNIFMYGVENPTDEGLYMRERVIPSLLHQASPLFNLPDCTFDVSELAVGSRHEQGVDWSFRHPGESDGAFNA